MIMLLDLHIGLICSATLNFDQVHFKHEESQAVVCLRGSERGTYRAPPLPRGPPGVFPLVKFPQFW